MPSFTKQDKHVVELYKKAITAQQQLEKDVEFRIEEEAIKELDGQFWQYLNGRLRLLVMEVQKAYQMKGISKAKIDAAERGVGDLLTMVNMYTHPDVIIQLTNEASNERLKAKMLEKMQKE